MQIECSHDGFVLERMNWGMEVHEWRALEDPSMEPLIEMEEEEISLLWKKRKEGAHGNRMKDDWWRG